MPLSRSTRRWALFGAAAMVAMAVAAAVMLWSQSRDRRVARQAEAEVVRFLTSLPGDHPITRRHGRFLRLEGTGFERSPQGVGRSGIPILITRHAVFFQTGAKLTIQVGRGRALSVGHFHMYPSEDQARTMPAAIRDNKIWFTRGTETISGSLSVAVYDPRGPAK